MVRPSFLLSVNLIRDDPLTSPVLAVVLPINPPAVTGSILKVEMVIVIGLIYKGLFPSISTFETPPIV
jgi:hypothetical protein